MSDASDSEVVPALQYSIGNLGRCLTCWWLRQPRYREHLTFVGVCYLLCTEDIHASDIYALSEAAKANFYMPSFIAIMLTNIFWPTKTNLNVFNYEVSC